MSPVSLIELSTATMGRPTAATVCLTVARALAGKRVVKRIHVPNRIVNFVIAG